MKNQDQDQLNTLVYNAAVKLLDDAVKDKNPENIKKALNNFVILGSKLVNSSKEVCRCYEEMIDIYTSDTTKTEFKDTLLEMCDKYPYLVGIFGTYLAKAIYIKYQTKHDIKLVTLALDILHRVHKDFLSNDDDIVKYNTLKAKCELQLFQFNYPSDLQELREQKKFEEAINLSKKCLQLSNNESDDTIALMHRDLLDTYSFAKMFGHAIEEFKKVTTLKVSENLKPEILQWGACCYNNADKMQEALAYVVEYYATYNNYSDKNFLALAKSVVGCSSKSTANNSTETKNYLSLLEKFSTMLPHNQIELKNIVDNIRALKLYEIGSHKESADLFVHIGDAQSLIHAHMIYCYIDLPEALRILRSAFDIDPIMTVQHFNKMMDKNFYILASDKKQEALLQIDNEEALLQVEEVKQQSLNNSKSIDDAIKNKQIECEQNQQIEYEQIIPDPKAEHLLFQQKKLDIAAGLNSLKNKAPYEIVTHFKINGKLVPQTDLAQAGNVSFSKDGKIKICPVGVVLNNPNALKAYAYLDKNGLENAKYIKLQNALNKGFMFQILGKNGIIQESNNMIKIKTSDGDRFVLKEVLVNQDAGKAVLVFSNKGLNHNQIQDQKQSNAIIGFYELEIEMIEVPLMAQD